MQEAQQKNSAIIEKVLGIPPDYQYKAIRSKNYLQANWHRNKIFVIQKLLNLNKNTSVMDLGPGSGNFELTFWKKVKNILAVDYNNEAISFLTKQLSLRHIKNVKTLIADIRDLYKRKDVEKYDYIVLADVIEHIRVSEAQKVVSQLRNFLNKDGKVMVITPNYKSTWFFLEWILDKITLLPKFNHQHLAKFYKGNLTRMFVKQGYRVDKISSFNLFSFLVPNKKMAKLLAELEISLSLPFGNLLVGIFALISTRKTSNRRCLNPRVFLTPRNADKNI